MIMGKTFSFISGALFGAAAGAIIGSRFVTLLADHPAPEALSRLLALLRE